MQPSMGTNDENLVPSCHQVAGRLVIQCVAPEEYAYFGGNALGHVLLNVFRTTL